MLTTAALAHFLAIYGYWAVLVFVMIESSGIPFPGESMLITAAVYAGTTHQLSIVGVIAAATAGAIIGDNLGFTVGRTGGYALIHRYGKYIRVDEKKLQKSQKFFTKHGDKTVFFGRFIAVLRAWAAFLAGVNHMAWPKFLVFNASGGILWATVFGLLGFFLGHNVALLERIIRTLGIGGVVVALLVVIVAWAIYRRTKNKHEQKELESEPSQGADQATQARP